MTSPTEIVSTLIPKFNLPDLGRITLPGGEKLDLRFLDNSAERALNTTTEIFVSVLLAVIVIMIGWFLANHLARYTQRALVRARLDLTFAAFMGSLARYALFFTSLLAAFQFLGISTASAFALFGAAGVAVAFALRDTLTHLAGGIMLLANRPFSVGDYIEIIDGSEHPQGTVKRITLFNTEINTLTNERVFLPNSKLWGNVAINHTYNEARMIEFKIPLPLGVRLKDVKAALLPVLQAEKLVLNRPEPLIGFDEHDMHHGLMIGIVQVWVRMRDYFEVRYGLLDSLNEALEDAGIPASIPIVVRLNEVMKKAKK